MARIRSESFEGTGYENPTLWTAHNDHEQVVNPDSAGPGTLPSGGGTQCLRISRGSSQGQTCSEYNHGSAPNIAYIRVYLYVDSHGMAADDSLDHIIAFGTNNADIASNSVGLKLLTVSSQLRVVPNYHDAGGWHDMTYADISVDTWYCVEFRIDVTNSVVAWRLDGNLIQSVNSVTLDRGGPRYAILGLPYGGDGDALDVYYDLFAIDDATWVGLETGGTGETTFNMRRQLVFEGVGRGIYDGVK